MSKFYKFKAKGKEDSKYLSVELPKYFTLKKTADSNHEIFELVRLGWNPFDYYYAIRTHTNNGKKYFSHKSNHLSLTDEISENEYWNMHSIKGGYYFNARKKSPLLTLTHANDKIYFQNGYRGDGEVWELIEVK